VLWSLPDAVRSPPSLYRLLRGFLSLVYAVNPLRNALRHGARRAHPLRSASPPRRSHEPAVLGALAPRSGPLQNGNPGLDQGPYPPQGQNPQTTWGSKVFESPRAGQTLVLLSRLNDAVAIVVCKTNTPEVRGPSATKP